MAAAMRAHPDARLPHGALSPGRRPRRRARLLCVLCVLWSLAAGSGLVACKTSSGPGQKPAAEPPRPAPLALACEPSLAEVAAGGGLGLRIGASVTRLPDTTLTLSHLLGLRIFPHTGDAVLVAFQGDRRIAQAPADPTLRRVSCVPPHGVETAVHEPGADFGWAVQAPGATTLYYPSRGVRALDLATLARRDLAPAPAATPCVEATAGTPWLLLLGLGAAADTLHATYGDYCHHEDWQGAAYSLRGLGSAQPTWQRRTPVATVVVAAGGRILLGDFAGCDILPSGTPGVVLASDDEGATFQRVSLSPANAEATPVAALGVSSDGRNVVALTATCNFGERPTWGGELFLSRDAGRSFVAIASPFVDRDQDDAYQGAATAATLPTSDLGRIVVSGIAYDGESSCHSYESADLGQSWTLQAHSACPPPSLAAQTAQARYFATDDGLLRQPASAGVLSRVYP
jgi:hypothetical protein